VGKQKKKKKKQQKQEKKNVDIPSAPLAACSCAS
jgi:hypothetical protein